MSGTIYREMILVENEIDETEQLYLQRLITRDRVEAYLRSGKYTDYRHKEAFLKVIFARDMGAINKDKYLAKRLNIEVSTVRSARKRMSEEAVAYIGKSPQELYDIILQGSAANLSSLVRQIELLENIKTTTDLFPFDIVNMVRNCSSTDRKFDLGECKKELAFLNWYSIEKIQYLLLNEYDIEKLRFILDIADNPANRYYRNVHAIVTCNNLLERVPKEDREHYIFPPVKPS